MTQYDFIFSNQSRHRLARHVAFWVVWWLSYLLLFHYPIHALKGWSLSETQAPLTYHSIRQIGFPLYILKTLIFTSLLSVVVPQAIFTYVLINWILPNYFFKKRKPVITVCIIIGVLLLFYFVFPAFKIFYSIGRYLLGESQTLTGGFSFKLATYSIVKEQLSSLPIVAGFALMIKLVKRWWLKQKETEQLANEKTKAELQLLKAQIHPHFLFNTLNNIYFFTLSGSPKAPEMIKKLSGLLHYIINECNQPLVPLQKEINMIRDYMALEKIRYGEQMNMSIEIQEEVSPPPPGEAGPKGLLWRRGLIAPLLLIPFVENSFKHGTSKMLAHPWLKLQITIENKMLHFSVINSRPQEQEPQLKKGNIGLRNVKKRLQLLYQGAHELNIVSEPESFAVYLKIQLQSNQLDATNEELKTTAAYAMA